MGLAALAADDKASAASQFVQASAQFEVSIAALDKMTAYNSAGTDASASAAATNYTVAIYIMSAATTPIKVSGSELMSAIG